MTEKPQRKFASGQQGRVSPLKKGEKMKIGAKDAIMAGSYFSVENRKISLEEQIRSCVPGIEQVHRVCSPERNVEEDSVEEKYRILSGNREQKVQELGLDYVDAFQCTWEEFCSLCQQVLDKTEYDAVPLEEVGITVEDKTAVMDCLSYLREWSERESAMGNMVGYHMGKQLSGAIANYSRDVRGETEYLEVDGETVKISIVEDGTWYTSFMPHLGSVFLDGENYFCIAGYADDSTAENPVVKIQVSSGEKGHPVGEYRVNLLEVDPGNATQLEMFALLCHRDKQGDGMENPYGDSSYMLGVNLGIFDYAVSLEEFANRKRDWVKAYEDKIKEIQSITENSMGDGTKQYHIANFYLPEKEWLGLLNVLEDYWDKEKERMTEEQGAES